MGAGNAEGEVGVVSRFWLYHPLSTCEPVHGRRTNTSDDDTEQEVYDERRGGRGSAEGDQQETEAATPVTTILDQGAPLPVADYQDDADESGVGRYPRYDRNSQWRPAT